MVTLLGTSAKKVYRTICEKCGSYVEFEKKDLKPYDFSYCIPCPGCNGKIRIEASETVLKSLEYIIYKPNCLTEG